MTTNALSIGVTPLSSLVIPHDYMRLRLHENGGATNLMSYERSASGVVTTGTWTIDGTTTNAWDVTGWYDNTGDGGVYFDDQSMDALCRLDNLSSGGLLILMNVNSSIDQASASKILQYGAAGGVAPGGWTWNVNATTSSLIAAPISGGTAAAHQSFALGEYTWCGFFDINGKTSYNAQNGDFAAAETADMTSVIAAGAAGTTDGDHGFSFMQSHTLSAQQGHVNETAGDFTIRDVWIVRFETDYLASIGAIFSQYHAAPYETPRLLGA